MITKRLLFLQIALLAGLSAVFLVPARHKIQPAGVTMQLPTRIGQWEGTDQKISNLELEGLAPDTQFARKIYRNLFGDEILMSVVLSGNDLDNSIHRPERCLPAQGWTIADARNLRIPMPQGPALEIMRLHNMRPIKMDDGNMKTLYGLNYYWFVGHGVLTASHFERTYIDIRDRVLHGYNQRWAYITIASSVTEGFSKFGRSEAEVDAMIRDFIVQVFPQIVIKDAALGDSASRQIKISSMRS